MYGTNAIVVSKTIRLDAKRRIILPSSTGAELSDKIYFIHDIYRTKLSLYNELEAEQKITHALNVLKEKLDKKIITYEEYRGYQRYICGKLCFAYEEVDKQRRLLIPERAALNLQLENQVYITGVENHIELYKSEEEFHRLTIK